ncbi:hypothetical protein GGR57DRAFT_148229 [Xylariaceae sp. FL1272]|nr:hypothetical protein GGR57DRAFT_148229 [Xylariaceae sp. FL1272]
MEEPTTQYRINEALVKSLSQTLISTGVTPVLWGDYLLTIYGVPSFVGGLDFIIPDAGLPGAISALKETENLSMCPDPHTCPVSLEKDLPLVPSFHMHLGTPASEIYVALWPHSVLLAFVPEANNSGESDVPGSQFISPYISATDTSKLPPRRLSRGRGVFSKGGGEVTLPSSHTLLEAYIRLASAYLDGPGPFYLSMITYVDEYIEEDGLLDEKLLSGPARKFWKGWQQGQLSMWGLCRGFTTDLEAEEREDSGVELLN